MGAYARLARLPPPKLGSVDVKQWLHRVVALEDRAPITVVDGPAITITADGDQLDQLLINLSRNAADAAIETNGRVTGKESRRGSMRRGRGPRAARCRNLFVPFFTTKENGSGIGLVLSRQIAEAHGGSLTLEHRRDRSGARALLRLPVGMSRELGVGS